MTPISIQAKKHFIIWFLHHCELKKQDGIWVLDHLLQHDSLLTNVHFVKEVINYPKGIMMTCRCSHEIAFRFHKQHIITNDIEKSFHDIRLHPEERMYVQLNFNQPGKHIYTSILEDQFFAHENKQVKQADQKWAGKVLDHVLYNDKIKRLRQQIDHALDQKDKASFVSLSKQWQKIVK